MTIRTPLLSFVLLLSLTGNALLWRALWATKTGAEAPSSPASKIASEWPSSESRGSSPDEVPSDSAGPLWAKLHSADLVELGRRLQAAGFPQRVIVAVIDHQLYRGRRDALKQARDETPYWQSPAARVEAVHREDAASPFARRRERQEILAAVFGPEAQLDGEEEGYETMFGPLPRQTLARVQRVEEDYAELEYQNLPKNASESAAFMKQRALLQEQKRADLAALLSPQELEEYDLRTSESSQYLRRQMAGVTVTEAEFRALFGATRDIYTKATASPATDQAAHQQAQAALEADLRPIYEAVLGAERYADYLQLQDPESQKLNQLMSRFDLPPRTGADVAATRRDVAGRADTIRRDTSLDATQRTAALAALHKEALSRLTTTLGPTVTEAYVNYDGQWLKALGNSR